MFKSAIPMLRVYSSAAAEEFYVGRLGFQRRFAFRFDETRPDPCYMGLVREGVQLHVTSFPGDGVVGSAVYLNVEDVDALHAELKAKGVAIALEPTDQTWGRREMYVRDPDGNTLRFARDEG